ncbi:Uncharacterized protein OBRU01_02128 [Operophtera brumata]|uniref:Uncharacterized protein n=1 Tax=Operophtera brumata TaxID=104452 RepID=A0A0L7LSW9_OPEBR|nr:Uncharacterized protein OBRU01_02128 [Operophtera brumata]
MATRYLPLPCLMADLYRGNNGLASLHLLSGVVPTVMALSGNDNPPLGNLMIACNILSMCYYSAQNNREWGWYTAGAALFSYYLAPQTGNKVAYPLGLALMVYCSYRLFHSHVDAAAVPVLFLCILYAMGKDDNDGSEGIYGKADTAAKDGKARDLFQDDNINASLAHILLCYISCAAGRGFNRISCKPTKEFSLAYLISNNATRYLALPCIMADLYNTNKAISIIHLVSGLIPFTMAVTGNENVQVGNIITACNIISLCHYSIKNNREWGWYMAAAGMYSYFVAPQAGTKIAYPLGLAVMVYCTCGQTNLNRAFSIENL